MQRPVRGYRGGIRNSSHLTHAPRDKDNDDDDNLSLSNSNSDEIEDDNAENDATIKSKNSSALISNAVGSDFESAIRNLRPLRTRPKKTPQISGQKADLPQLNMISDKTNEQIKNQQSHHWFPKADIGHVDSKDFFRHNHVESQQIIDQLTPPALLTTIPPVGISTRPTAIIASAGPTRSASAFFSSYSSIKKANSNSTYDLQNYSTLKSPQQLKTSSLIQTASSAFQPINSIQKVINQQTKTSSQSVPLDIPQHKSLQCGQKLTKVHISHPESPSVIHLMLHEDFQIACRLLHKMTAHPELQSDFIPPHRFKPKINHICACFHEGRWFRCRILQISPHFSTASVVYLDWGMVIPVQIEPTYIRHLPNEFYTQSACSIKCHLDGVPDSNDLIPSDTIGKCISLLNENEYDATVNDYDNKITLSINGKNINEQIRGLLQPNKFMSSEDELIEQFQHELQLSVGDEVKALLSSFGGKDDSFYVLLINENTVAIDRAMSELQEDHIPNREFLQIPQIKSIVVARYADDRKYYRAWVKSVDISNEQATVFFVDFGNESKVLFSDIYICPESVRTLPWLGIHVRLTNEFMTTEELTTFWKFTEAHYIWIRIDEILKDSYGIQIKIDFTVYLRQERLKMLTSKRSINKGVQTKLDEKFLSSKINSERNPSSLINDQNQIGNLFEMINNELRSLRHRVNDSDESSQDRHSQLMQLLFSLANSNNTNQQKKIC